MKKIVIAGGTGMIGNHLTKMLVNSGYEVSILTRNPSKYQESEFVKYAALNTNDLAGTIKQLEGVYSVVNLSGAGVADKKWTNEYKKEIYDSRINITSHLIYAVNAAEKPPQSFISASAIGIYGNRADEKLNEKSQVSDTFLAKVCVDWEYEADKCRVETRLVKARIGVVLAMEGGALPQMLTPFKFFAGGAIGSGKQWLSWIHIEDICRLFLFCIENNEASGVFNFVAPNPVTMNDFAKELGRVISRPSFFKVPEFVLRIILGESADIVLASQRIYPTASEHSGFIFKHYELNSALKNLLK